MSNYTFYKMYLLDDEVLLKPYDSTFSGYIQSWLDRFPHDNVLDDLLEEIADNDRKYFADLLD